MFVYFCKVLYVGNVVFACLSICLSDVLTLSFSPLFNLNKNTQKRGEEREQALHERVARRREGRPRQNCRGAEGAVRQGR